MIFRTNWIWVSFFRIKHVWLFVIEVNTHFLYCFYDIFRTSNIDDFSQDVRMLGALQDDDASRNKLLGAAKRLCGAFSDLLNAAEPGQKEVSKLCQI